MAIIRVSGPAEHRGTAKIRLNHFLAPNFLLTYSNQEGQTMPTL